MEETIRDFANTAEARFYLDVVIYIWLGILSIGTYLMRRHQVTEDRVTRLAGEIRDNRQTLERQMADYAPSQRLQDLESRFELRFDGLNDRLVRIEERMPTSAEIRQLHGSMDGLRQAVKYNDEDRERIRSTIERIDQYLRDRDSRLG